MAGGTGAGKTSAIERVEPIKQIADTAHAVYDTNIANAASAEKKIRQALDAGHDVHIAYVYRDPAEALQNGTLPRAMRIQRTVPLDTHADTHALSGQAIEQLRKTFAGDKRVTFSSIDNSLGKGNAKLSPIELPDGKRYTVPAEELRHVADEIGRAHV